MDLCWLEDREYSFGQIEFLCAIGVVNLVPISSVMNTLIQTCAPMAIMSTIWLEACSSASFSMHPYLAAMNSVSRTRVIQVLEAAAARPHCWAGKLHFTGHPPNGLTPHWIVAIISNRSLGLTGAGEAAECADGTSVVYRHGLVHTAVDYLLTCEVCYISSSWSPMQPFGFITECVEAFTFSASTTFDQPLQLLNDSIVAELLISTMLDLSLCHFLKFSTVYHE